MGKKRTMDSRQKEINLAIKKPRTDARKARNVAKYTARMEANLAILREHGVTSRDKKEVLNKSTGKFVTKTYSPSEQVAKIKREAAR